VRTQEAPILPSGDVSFGEQLAAELDEEAGPPGTAATASVVRALRSYTRERADTVAAGQELLMTRIDRAELLAADAMRRASRAGAVGRMLAADLKHGACCAARGRLLAAAAVAARAWCAAARGAVRVWRAGAWRARWRVWASSRILRDPTLR
jgi:hypothetical protein